jgi:DNA helicase-2/ATP-dependent DNA helicase PcrA
VRDDFPYSPAQRALIQTPGSLFVEACPGAGKTRAIVGRFLHSVQGQPRQGVALVSFTNAAVDEVKTRSAQAGAVIAAPHFIGTFDSFINRLIVTPIYTAGYKIPVRFVDTWASTSVALVRVPGERSAGYSLDYFTFNADSTAATLVPERVPYPHRRLAEALSQPAREQLQSEAVERLRRLVRGELFTPKSGLINAETARSLAARWLKAQTWGPRIIDVLAARFAEIIVDEAQDCGPEELAVLGALKNAGVQIVMVGDLDQAIYEFRRAQPTAVRDFARLLPRGRRLNGNYRSTPAICSAVASLRTGDSVDEPVGRHREATTPVHLLAFTQLAEVRTAVASVSNERGFTSADVMVLAHKTADAIKAAGGTVSQGRTATNRVLRIAGPSLVLRESQSAPRQRTAAIHEIEHALLEIAGCADDGSDTARVEHLGATPRWLRDQARRLAWGLDPRQMDAAAYTEALRDRLAQITWPGQVTIQRLQTPGVARWTATLGRQPDATMLPFSTVHGAKGMQYPVAVVVLPEELPPNEDGRTCLDLWELKHEGEARRVLYVAASRAEQLLILATHVQHAERVVAILERDGVPHHHS